LQLPPSSSSRSKEGSGKARVKGSNDAEGGGKSGGHVDGDGDEDDLISRRTRAHHSLHAVSIEQLERDNLDALDRLEGISISTPNHAPQFALLHCCIA
jgi:hypothetical protein